MSATKKKRIEQVLQLMENREEKRTLPEWLHDINNSLSANHTFKNTKELAHAFKYMKRVVGTEIHRTKTSTTYSKEKNTVTLYEIKG